MATTTYHDHPNCSYRYHCHYRCHHATSISIISITTTTKPVTTITTIWQPPATTFLHQHHDRRLYDHNLKYLNISTITILATMITWHFYYHHCHHHLRITISNNENLKIEMHVNKIFHDNPPNSIWILEKSLTSSIKIHVEFH